MRKLQTFAIVSNTSHLQIRPSHSSRINVHKPSPSSDAIRTHTYCVHTAHKGSRFYRAYGRGLIRDSSFAFFLTRGAAQRTMEKALDEDWCSLLSRHRLNFPSRSHDGVLRESEYLFLSPSAILYRLRTMSRKRGIAMSACVVRLAHKQQGVRTLLKPNKQNELPPPHFG